MLGPDMNRFSEEISEKNNIILIGMPSSGKSTIGPMLAQNLGMGYIDTDALVESSAGKKLSNVVSEDGLERFFEIQEHAVLAIDKANHVISTGGSIVYSDAAMKKLKENGIVVYLEVPLAELAERLDSGRRLARSEGQSIEKMYAERTALYLKYSDITVNCSGKQPRVVLNEVENHLKSVI